MAKRVAESQITQDSTKLSHDHEDDNEPGPAKLASAEMLAKRQLKMPKSKLGARFGASSSAPSGGSNPFAAAAKAVSQNGASKPANPFQLAAQKAKEAVKAKSSEIEVQKPQPPFAKETEQSAEDTKSILASQMKALNDNFMNVLKVTADEAPLADFSQYCVTYIKYVKQIKEHKVGEPLDDGKDAQNLVSSANTTKTITSNDVKKSAVVADSDSEDEIEIKGPSFTVSKKIESSVFKFGSNNEKSNDAPEVAKGPQFTLDMAKKSGGSGGSAFKWGKSLDKTEPKSQEPKADTSKPAFSFGSVTKPAFNFGTSSNKDEAKSAFSFGQSSKSDDSKKDDAKPAFSFGVSKKLEESSKPAFSFGSASTEKKDDTKPAFSFGSTSSEKKDDSKPAFSFGSGSTEKKSESKPAFSFGSGSAEKKSESKPVFSFGSTEKKDDAKPAFSFGSTEKKDDAKPAFSFGSAEKKDDSKPSFNFGSTTSKPVFAFGSTGANSEKKDENSTKPAFTFNSTEKSDVFNKPAFNFGTTSDAGAKPVFKFGSTDSKTDGEKPKFSFGSNTSENGTTAKLSFSFSFQKPATADSTKTESKPTFSFGTSSAGTTAVPTTKSQTESTDSEPKDEVPETTSLEPKDEVLSGEEHEDLKYNKKSKLLLLNKDKYDTKGLGFLRILQHKETKKCRMLLRAEGSNRIIFNQYILKDIKYDLVGKNGLKVPVFDKDGKMEIYILRVKDGNELLELVKELQK